MKSKLTLVQINYRLADSYEEVDPLPHVKRRDSIVTTIFSQNRLTSMDYKENHSRIYVDRKDPDYVYTMDLLRDKDAVMLDNDNKPNFSKYYYMIFKKTDLPDGTSVLYIDIVLKDGFLAALAYSVSEYFLSILRQVVSYLYENELRSSRFVGYYMRVLLNSSIYENLSIQKFLLGDSR